MTSATTWNSRNPPRSATPRVVRRRRALIAVAAVTIAFVIAGAALLAAVGTLTWTTSVAAVPAGGAPPIAVPASATDDGADQEQREDEPTEEVDHDTDTKDGTELPDQPDAPGATAPPGGAGTSEDATDGADGVGGDGADHRGDDHGGDDAGDTSGEVAGDVGEVVGGDTADAAPQLSTQQVQEKLRSYGFLVGPADGAKGQQTVAAVMAYQRVNGLSVDGVVGPATTAALLAGSAEPTLAGGVPDRIEVDLDAQLLHLVEGGERTVTLQVSSGSGGTYTTASGGSARSVTPVGSFTVERRIHGVRVAPLGELFDPLYFHRGFAIHGSPSVPAYPASHGCIRVSKADAVWLIQRVPDGMPVHLYGGTHVFTP